MRLFWATVISYLVGSFPTAAVIAKKIGGFSIFGRGSGNPGASNIFRTLGARWALLVLLVDMLKGYIPVRLSEEWIERIAEEHPRVHPETIKAIIGLAAVGGHVFPVTTRFRGGKGAATLGGVMVAIAPLASSVSLLTWVTVLYMFRKFSLASLVASMVFPAAIYTFEGKRTLASLGWGLLVPLLLATTHRENIARLRYGEELPMTMKEESA